MKIYSPSRPHTPPLPAGFSGCPKFMVGDPGEWILDGWLEYDGVRVPSGYITDLASIPGALQGLFHVNDETRLPAVVHDWLYTTQERSRAQADELLYRMMRAAGSPRWKAVLFFHVVRTFGGSHWDFRKQLGGPDSLYDFGWQ